MMNKHDVVDICYIRESITHRCEDCIYFGAKCDYVKRVYGIDRPSDVFGMTDAEINEYNKKRRFKPCQ